MKLWISEGWTMMTEEPSNEKQGDGKSRNDKEIRRFVGLHIARHVY